MTDILEEAKTKLFEVVNLFIENTREHMATYPEDYEGTEVDDILTWFWES